MVRFVNQIPKTTKSDRRNALVQSSKPLQLEFTEALWPSCQSEQHNNHRKGQELYRFISAYIQIELHEDCPSPTGEKQGVNQSTSSTTPKTNDRQRVINFCFADDVRRQRSLRNPSFDQGC